MNQSVAIIIVTLLILGGTFVLNLIISNRISKKDASSASEDWEVGGRSLPLFVVVGTQFTTAMGGGLLVGQVGNGYKNGLSVMLYGVLCQLAFIILMIIAKWLREKQFATIPTFLCRRCPDDTEQGAFPDKNKRHNKKAYPVKDLMLKSKKSCGICLFAVERNDIESGFSPFYRITIIFLVLPENLSRLFPEWPRRSPGGFPYGCRRGGR